MELSEDHWADAIGTRNVVMELTDDSLVLEVEAINGTLFFEMKEQLKNQTELIMKLQTSDKEQNETIMKLQNSSASGTRISVTDFGP